jgi:hypothetical protein
VRLTEEEYVQLQRQAGKNLAIGKAAGGNCVAVDGVPHREGKPLRRNKYGVAPKADRTMDGIVFHSKREMQRYAELKLLVKAGRVDYFLRQVPFDLPGGVKYRADFLIVWNDWSAGVTIEDVKGAITKMYALKKKQVEALYGVRIEEV